MRPTWDKIWINFAHDIAERSPDPKHKVGAVVVNSSNTQVLSIGYNGDQKGGENQRESMEVGGSGFIHAEINALIKCDFNYPGTKKMYLTLSPCRMCAKAIVNAGIDEVIYAKEYAESNGIDILKEAGIAVKAYARE